MKWNGKGKIFLRSLLISPYKHISREKRRERRQWPDRHLRHGRSCFYHIFIIVTTWTLLDRSPNLREKKLQKLLGRSSNLREEELQRKKREMLGWVQDGRWSRATLNRIAKINAMTILPFLIRFICKNTSDLLATHSSRPLILGDLGSVGRNF